MALAPDTSARLARDERLDFFRGVTMLIIFIAHLPENGWNAWIPARFGFSSGAELFVFCSGIASAYAFGGTFIRRGFMLGAARIGYRIWQVYWTQCALVVALIALAAGIDQVCGLDSLRRQFEPLLLDPARALLGIMTLTWQPDYLDILPMYLVILALVPVMMLLWRLHPLLPIAAAVLLHALVWFAGLDLPGNPWNGAGWFLNPFAWQLIFFLGFFFALKWLPSPRLGDSRLMAASGLIVLLAIPLSFWGVLAVWPEAQALRDIILPATEKSALHPLRVIHFLALAYIVLSLIEPWRQQLDSGVGHVFILIGRQSLASFIASVVLARLAGIIASAADHDALIVALLNLTGMALILAVALIVGWFKSAPWSARGAPPAKAAPARNDPMILPTRVREPS